MTKYKIGSLFSGIGGFELGLERAIPAETIWQVEQDEYCQKVLKKHWPKARIYNDVRDINKETVDPVDILCGGFPCQDISVAGRGEGLNGKKSSLYWEMFRIICDLRPRVIIMENVPAITFRGGLSVIGSLASAGYSSEWRIISAQQFGAPHIRKRWFCVSYSNCNPSRQDRDRQEQDRPRERNQSEVLYKEGNSYSENSREVSSVGNAPYSNKQRFQEQSISRKSMDQKQKFEQRSSKIRGLYKRNYWERCAPKSPICRVDDGISHRMDRVRALGNAIVPQCSQWVGEQIWNSGILQRE